MEPELTKAINELTNSFGRVLNLYADALSSELPIAHAEAIWTGVDAQKVGLRFTVDFGAQRKFDLTCDAIEEDKTTRLLTIDGVHSLGKAQLFLL